MGMDKRILLFNLEDLLDFKQAKSLFKLLEDPLIFATYKIKVTPKNDRRILPF